MGDVEFRVLGSFEASSAGRPLELGGMRQRLVLAALVVALPREVSAIRLMESVWDGRQPSSAVATLQAYVSRLRRALAGTDCRVTGERGAYRLTARLESVDATRFERAVALAGADARVGRYARVVSTLEPALRSWRGSEPLEDLDAARWAPEWVAALLRQRDLAGALLADAYLELGRNDDAQHLLDVLRAAHPYDEVIVRQLMLARYRAGRSVDALVVFASADSQFRHDLGIDLSPETHVLQRDILRRDPRLDWHAPKQLLTRTLPPRLPRFHDRSALMEQTRQAMLTNRVVALHGLAGCGKTSLALELAYLHEGIVCWVNAHDRAAASASLADLGSALGIDVGEDERDLVRALWDYLVAGDGWLMVLDDAMDPDLVRDLLPPFHNGNVLLTSNRVDWAAYGAAVEVGVFDPEEALAFTLDRLDRAEAGAARHLTDALGGHPLALSQACSYIQQAGLDLEDYLRMFRRNYDVLLLRGTAAGHRASVTTTWRMLFDQVRHASQVAAQVLEVTAFCAAEGVPITMLLLIGDDPVAIADAMAQLVRFSLIQRDGDRLRMHSLVQTVVRSGLPATVRRERVSQAVALIQRVAAGRPDDPEHWAAWGVAAPQAAALLRACETADESALTTQLGLDAAGFLRSQGALDSAVAVVRRTLDLALNHDPGSPARVALIRGELASLLDEQGDLRGAKAELEESLAAMSHAREMDGLARARILERLAHAHNCADEPLQAVDLYRQAIAAFRGGGRVGEEVHATIGLGYTLWSLDRFGEAERLFRAALHRLSASGVERHPLLLEAHSGLGMMLHEQGRLEEAVHEQDHALQLLDELQVPENHLSRAEVLDKHGYVLGLLGDYEGSRRDHLAAAQILERLFGAQDPRHGMALTNLGLALSRLGRTEEARVAQVRALGVVEAAYGSDHRHVHLIRGRLAAITRVDSAQERMSDGGPEPMPSTRPSPAARSTARRRS